VILGVIFSASLKEAFAIFQGCNFFADFHSDDNNDEERAGISFFTKQQAFTFSSHFSSSSLLLTYCRGKI